MDDRNTGSDWEEDTLPTGMPCMAELTAAEEPSPTPWAEGTSTRRIEECAPPPTEGAPSQPAEATRPSPPAPPRLDALWAFFRAQAGRTARRR